MWNETRRLRVSSSSTSLCVSSAVTVRVIHRRLEAQSAKLYSPQSTHTAASALPLLAILLSSLNSFSRMRSFEHMSVNQYWLAAQTAKECEKGSNIWFHFHLRLFADDNLFVVRFSESFIENLVNILPVMITNHFVSPSHCDNSQKNFRNFAR